ncbi:hypothetical protein [Streptomyces sp. NE5-10]|uniref:hypothetical protein n=1 Tax=Streptomyces sp. NE5-10 TaxID=2759674 RepID=UPI00190498FF|nr:hypothetical protein [Streptomyces sp. NE5-10]
MAAIVLVGSGVLRTWMPDVFATLCGASAAGTVVIALRLWAVVRADGGGVRRRALSIRGSAEAAKNSGDDRAGGPGDAEGEMTMAAPVAPIRDMGFASPPGPL